MACRETEDFQLAQCGDQEVLRFRRQGMRNPRLGLRRQGVISIDRHSGAMRSIEPGISRFRVWSFGPSRNDQDSQDKHPMSVTTLPHRPARTLVHRQPGWLVRLFDYKPFLIVVCLTPAIGLLAVFLTYPLGLGVWLAFTDTTIGRRGVFVGLENFQYLLTDPLWWNAVFYSVLYTAVATFGKFALVFWLAWLLNNHFPFKLLLRTI